MGENGFSTDRERKDKKKKDTFGKGLVLGCTWPWRWAEGGLWVLGSAQGCAGCGVGREPFSLGKRAIKQIFPTGKTINALLQWFDSAKCIYRVKDALAAAWGCSATHHPPRAFPSSAHGAAHCPTAVAVSLPRSPLHAAFLGKTSSDPAPPSISRPLCPGSPVARPAQHPSASATTSEAELCIALQVHTSVANVILSKEPFFLLLLPDQSGKTLQQAAALQHAVENPPPARQGWFSQGNNW